MCLPYLADSSIVMQALLLFVSMLSMTMSDAFQEFKGPLEAIICQIQENELDLFELQLTTLAVDFQKDMPLELYEGAKFIAALAHLMYLKAFKLIPKECDADEEEASFFEHDLEEYTTFKKAALEFSEKEREQLNYFLRKPIFEQIEPAPLKLESPISLDEFSQIFAGILEQAQKRNVTISDDMYSVADVIDDIEKCLEKKRLTFSELFLPEHPRLLLIVTFLAILELMKNGKALLFSENNSYFLEKP